MVARNKITWMIQYTCFKVLKANFLSGSQAKKRQIYLEETYGGSMRELEMLVNTFSVESETGTKKGKSQSSNFFYLKFSPYYYRPHSHTGR